MVKAQERNDEEEADFGDYDQDFDLDEADKVHREAERLAR